MSLKRSEEPIIHLYWMNKMNWSDEKIIIINSFLPEVKQANKIEETINRLVEFASLTNNQNLFELRKLPLSERQVVVDLFEQTAGCASLAEKKGLISNQDKTNIFDFLDKKVVSPNLSFPINDIRNGESSIILRQMFVDEFNPKLRIDVKNEIENSLPQEMISKNSKILSLGQHVQTIEKIRNNLTEKLLFEKILTDIAHYQFFDASSIKNIRAQNDLFKQREMIRDYFIKNENDGKLSLSQMMKMRSDEIIKIFANDSNITAEIATIENNLKEDWKREMDTKSFSEEKYKNRAEYVWERYFFLTGLIDKHKTESERYLPLEN